MAERMDGGIRSDAVERRQDQPVGDLRMLDAILVAAGIGFFAVAILYAVACDRL